MNENPASEADQRAQQELRIPASPGKEKLSSELRKFSVVRTLSLALLVLTLPVSVILVQMRSVDTKTQAAAAEADVYFVPEEAEVPPEREFRLMIDSRGKMVSFVHLELVYDPAVLNLAGEIRMSPKLDKVNEITDAGTANIIGRVVIEAETADPSPVSAPAGVFELATLRFVSAGKTAGVTAPVKVDIATAGVVDTGGSGLEIVPHPAIITVSSKDQDSVLGISTDQASGFSPADMDGNGCVDLSDMKLLAEMMGKHVVAGMKGDLNGDGVISAADAGMWLSVYGQGCVK